jgi:predicted transcriptional regulator
MVKRVKDLTLPLADYAVVDRDKTIFDALKALETSQQKLPPGRQPHRAILVRDRSGEIVGKIHQFAFLRALVPDRKLMGAMSILDRAGVGDDLRESSMQALEFLTADLIDVCERARNVRVADVYTPTTVSIDEHAPLLDSVTIFLRHQTLSLLVTRGGRTVGILRLSDLFDELARQILRGDCTAETD